VAVEIDDRNEDLDRGRPVVHGDLAGEAGQPKGSRRRL
jgi:hypothetical protein